ncbi:MAG: 4Fe-4S single cluster domain-containing protein [Thermoplasmataceae archaeon]
MDLIINSIDYRGSIVNGPGLRTVLFVQGCEQKCKGCHNPYTWNINLGKPTPVSELTDEIRNNSITKKFTISGGEPLLQTPMILELVKKLDDFNIVLYTGYEFEDVQKELLEHLDYIKVGKYEQGKRCTTIDYIGSTNQRFISLKGVNK